MSDNTSRYLGVKELIERQLYPQFPMGGFNQNALNDYALAVTDDLSIGDDLIHKDVTAAVAGRESGHTKYYHLLRPLMSK